MSMKKPRIHAVDSLAVAYMKEMFSEWVFNELPEDYSLDLIIQITEEEILTKHIFFIQSKGTDSIDISGDFVNYDIKTKYLKFYEILHIPVFVVRFDTVERVGYWINSQKFIRDLNNKKPDWRNQKNIRLKIPVTNRLDDLTTLKNEIINSFNEMIVDFISKSDWFLGKESFLNDLEKMEEINEREEIRLIRQKLHLSQTSIQQNLREKGVQYLVEIYSLKKHNIEHLQAIYMLIVSKNILQVVLQPHNLYELCKEGIEISQELNHDYFLLLFSFYEKLLKFTENVSLNLLLIGHRHISTQQNIKLSDVVISYLKYVSLNLEISLVSQRDEIFGDIKEMINKGYHSESLILIFAMIMVENHKLSVLSQVVEEEIITNSMKGRITFLKKLEEIVLELNDVTILLPFYHHVGGLRSVGFKFINCKRFSYSFRTLYALRDFEFFKISYCNSCKFREPRDSEWFATISFLKKIEEEN